MTPRAALPYSLHAALDVPRFAEPQGRGLGGREAALLGDIMPTPIPVLVEIRAAEGGSDAKQLVREMRDLYLKFCARRSL